MDSARNVLQPWADSTVLTYPIASFLLIIGLVIVIIILLIRFNKKEGFMPTTLVAQQQSDTLGMTLSGLEQHDYTPNWEHATSGPAPSGRAASAFAQQTQDTTDFSYGPVSASAKSGDPGSMAYQVLHSPNYGCATRVPIGDDAWGWMQNVANENFKGLSADRASAISQGQR